MVVDWGCLKSGCDLPKIFKQEVSFLSEKEVQKRLRAFLQNHPHQPLEVVACSTQHRMNGVIRLTLEVTAIKPVV